MVAAGDIPELSESRAWTARPSAADLTSLPATPAVCLFVDAADQAVQLATTQHLRRFAESRLLAPVETTGPTGRADLGEIVRGVRWRPVDSPFEARWRHYLAARTLYPREYRKMIGFGPAWFLNLDREQPIPEIRLTERIWSIPGAFIGPWPERQSAQRALEGLWDLFELCRYPEQVRKAPLGKRCAYADMGRCDAPCDGGAPMDAYRGRTAEAWRFASGEIGEWIERGRARMSELAAAREYERASMVKQQVDFALHWRQNWSATVSTDDRMEYLLATPVTRRRKWKLFGFRRGRLVEGPVLSDKRLPAHGAAWALGANAVLSDRPEEGIEMEQTWLMAQFMHHADAKRAILVRPAEAAGDVARLAELLSRALDARRSPSEPLIRHEGSQ